MAFLLTFYKLMEHAHCHEKCSFYEACTLQLSGDLSSRQCPLAFRPAAFIVKISPVLLSQSPYWPQNRNLLHSFMTFLLIMVESNSGSPGIKFGFWNVCGINRQGTSIIDIINDNSLDPFAICETWIQEQTP